MAKSKEVNFLCTECGATFPKWTGQCNQCNSWNTVKEYKVSPVSSKTATISGNANPLPTAENIPNLSQISAQTVYRTDMPFTNLQNVLGGGLVNGSVVLLAGEPGIGKSTLFLQTALLLKGRKVLYNSAEESPYQVKIHAQRFEHPNQENVYITSEISVGRILHIVEEIKPEILVIDSIQTVCVDAVDSSPGTVTQIRESASVLIRLAKEKNITLLIIGHITKDGQIAGPKLLEHMVDVVLHFEGSKKNTLRWVRSVKNRFGPTHEVGIYEMSANGLKVLDNPSGIFLDSALDRMSGHSIAVIQDSNQKLLVECQALVGGAVYGTPQRNTNGIENKRLHMLLAIIEKRGGISLRDKDVFFNIIGNLKINDTAIDLAVIAAILSSTSDVPIEKGWCFCGEVGLSGEIRSVSNIEKSIIEADRLGFTTIVIPQKNKEFLDKNAKLDSKIRIIAMEKIQQLIQLI